MSFEKYGTDPDAIPFSDDQYRTIHKLAMKKGYLMQDVFAGVHTKADADNKIKELESI